MFEISDTRANIFFYSYAVVKNNGLFTVRLSIRVDPRLWSVFCDFFQTK